MVLDSFSFGGAENLGDEQCRGDIEGAVSAADLGESVRILDRRDDVAEILRTVDGAVTA
jgi:hypothetical protein